jgi:two-component system NtrC family response regulator
LRLPPLRERCTDIDLLAEHFLSLMGERSGVRRRLGPGTIEVLRRHPWPGNVRELKHVIEAAVVVSDGPELLPEHLPIHATPVWPGLATAVGDATPLARLDEMERAHITRVLHAMDGHRGHAARVLGISERNLYRKLREYGLLH